MFLLFLLLFLLPTCCFMIINLFSHFFNPSKQKKTMKTSQEYCFVFFFFFFFFHILHSHKLKQNERFVFTNLKMRKRTNERLTEGEREREIEMTGVCALSSSSFLLLLPPIISEVYKYMRVKKSERMCKT